MRPFEPSRSATWVAFERGLSSLDQRPIVRDGLAEGLVPEPYRALLRAARAMPSFTAVGNRLYRALTAGISCHIAFRTRAIDEAIETAARAGATQLVIVGAGLDSRAWRLGSLGRVDVYEVDHPATQKYKEAQTAGLAPLAKSVTFVAADLEREPLAAALDRTGHDASRPTIFLWEGVTMYLSAEAVEQTLGTLAARSREGSTLILSYWEQPVMNAALRFVMWMVSKVGEPIRSTFGRDAMKTLLARHGFETLTDGGTIEWSTLYLEGRFRTAPERVICGTRTGARAALSASPSPTRR